MNKKDAKERIKEMRKADKEFDDLVTLIEISMEEFTKPKQDKKSYYAKEITPNRVNFKVKAIPITFEQKEYLLRYLKDKYITLVRGDYFKLKKCWFSKKYRIKSYEYNCDPFI